MPKTTTKESKAAAAAVAAAVVASKRRQQRIPGVKRPKSGYTFFCNQQWEAVKSEVSARPEEEGSTTKLQCAIMKELSLRWKALPAKRRTPFEKLAKKDSVRYRTERDRYLSTQPPKKPRNNPYIYFFKETQELLRRQHPELKQSEIAQKVATLWPEVRDNPSKVQKYEKSFQQDLHQYNARMGELSSSAVA